MKKIFIVSLIFASCYFKINAQQNKLPPMISDIQIKNSFIIIFDSNGKEISRMPQAKNEVKGIATSFFIVTNNGWIITYDEKCKVISKIPQTHNEVKGAVGETFTTLNYGWTITYDKHCKILNRRPTK